jgi:hypothetical protein
MPIPYEHILRDVESLSRAEQLRLISELTENLRLEATPGAPTSILDLQGLGKVWQGVDAQDYVDSERSSWNG